MTKTFTYLNFVLLLVLGGVCVVQWSREKDYGAQITALARTSDIQQSRIAEQTDELRRTSEDLDGFRTAVANLKSQADEQVGQIREQKAQIFTLEHERERLSKQLTQWQQSLAEHRAAIATRDENIKTLLGQRDQILAANKDAAEKANQAVVAYNELASKYEDVVTRYNTLATQYKTEREAAQAPRSN